MKKDLFKKTLVSVLAASACIATTSLSAFAAATYTVDSNAKTLVVEDKFDEFDSITKSPAAEGSTNRNAVADKTVNGGLYGSREDANPTGIILEQEKNEEQNITASYVSVPSGKEFGYITVPGVDDGEADYEIKVYDPGTGSFNLGFVPETIKDGVVQTYTWHTNVLIGDVNGNGKYDTRNEARTVVDTDVVTRTPGWHTFKCEIRKVDTAWKATLYIDDNEVLKETPISAPVRYFCIKANVAGVKVDDLKVTAYDYEYNEKAGTVVDSEGVTVDKLGFDANGQPYWTFSKATDSLSEVTGATIDLFTNENRSTATDTVNFGTAVSGGAEVKFSYVLDGAGDFVNAKLGELTTAE